MLKTEDSGSTDMTINMIVKVAIIIVFVACSLAVFGSFAGDIMNLEHMQLMVYIVIALISVASA